MQSFLESSIWPSENDRKWLSWVTNIWKSAPSPVLSCMWIMQNIQACFVIYSLKGIRVDRPPPQFKNDTRRSTPLPDLKHLMPRKWTVSDLASLGRLNQFAPGNKSNDLRLEDSSWKLQQLPNKKKKKKKRYLSPESSTSPSLQRIINSYTSPRGSEITFFQETKSTLNLRQIIIREGEELEEDGDGRWGDSI